jgi:hypothetical protein
VLFFSGLSNAWDRRKGGKMKQIMKMAELPHECMVFGYGSLMSTDGLRGRGMKRVYTNEELFPVHAKGLRRSMSAEWRRDPWPPRRYYSVSPDPSSVVFGTLFTIRYRLDLIALLTNEYASPIITDDRPTYEVWDISDCLPSIFSGNGPALTLMSKELKDNPAFYAPGYVKYVYDRLPGKWKEPFLLTGGKKP